MKNTKILNISMLEEYLKIVLIPILKKDLLSDDLRLTKLNITQNMKGKKVLPANLTIGVEITFSPKVFRNEKTKKLKKLDTIEKVIKLFFKIVKESLNDSDCQMFAALKKRRDKELKEFKRDKEYANKRFYLYI